MKTFTIYLSGKKMPAIVKASKKGDINSVDLHIKKGSDVNAKDSQGATALMHASLAGHLEVVKKLIRAGAIVDCEDNELWTTPLGFAALEGHLEICKILIEHGANVNNKIYQCATPLHFAVSNGHLDVCNLLMNNGADINAVDDIWNVSPFLLAVENRHLKITNLFLNKGNPDIYIQDDEDFTALMYATYYEQIDLIKRILSMTSDKKYISNAIEVAYSKIEIKELAKNTVINSQVKKDKIVLNFIPPNFNVEVVDVLEFGLHK